LTARHKQSSITFSNQLIAIYKIKNNSQGNGLRITIAVSTIVCFQRLLLVFELPDSFQEGGAIQVDTTGQLI
jgi:hypothetical protein